MRNLHKMSGIFNPDETCARVVRVNEQLLDDEVRLVPLRALFAGDIWLEAYSK
jgi:hypothetical protein